MQPIGVFNYFTLCFLVFICITADAVDNANGGVDDSVADGDNDDTVSDVATDDAVADGNVSDPIGDGYIDDSVADESHDDAVNDGGVDDAVPDGGVDDAVADGGVNDIVSDGSVDDAVAGGTVDGADDDGAVKGIDRPYNPGADQPVDSIEMNNDVINGDKNENVKKGDASVEDQQSISAGVQDDNEALINDSPGDVSGEGFQWSRLDKTYVDPGFKLSPTEIKKFKLWPNATVPYYIDEFSYDKVLRDKIRERLNNVRRYLRYINFEELPEPLSDENERWIFFVNRRGQLDCKDYSPKSFTNTGVQKVVVGYDCFEQNRPMAAIVLALLGVPPMHNAPNRDKYITIRKEHILPEKMGLYKRLKNDEWLFHDIEYDYNSVSHYPLHKYTADGIATITIRYEKNGKKRDSGSKTGKQQKRTKNALTNPDVAPKDFSPTDIYKVSLLYQNLWYLKANKGLKLEDCKGLYRSEPGLSNTRLNQPKKLPEKPKPKLYLTAVKKLYGIKDVYGETLSSLERQ